MEETKGFQKRLNTSFHAVLNTSNSHQLQIEIFASHTCTRNIIGSLSNDDDDARDDALKKMNLYFTSEIRDCLDLFGTPMALKTEAKYATTAFKSKWK